jgi:rubrerythrin
MIDELELQLEVLVDELLDQVAVMRAQDPAAGYAGRVYICDSCRSVDAVAAPWDELPDDYPCPTCGAPQRPLTDAGVPLQPNRAARRAALRRRP